MAVPEMKREQEKKKKGKPKTPSLEKKNFSQQKKNIVSSIFPHTERAKTVFDLLLLPLTSISFVFAFFHLIPLFYFPSIL
jgi:hypothetical protein